MPADPRPVVAGTKGYDEHADALVARYERIPFAEKHAPVLHLIPAAPCRALDIGAGTGAESRSSPRTGARA